MSPQHSPAPPCNFRQLPAFDPMLTLDTADSPRANGSRRDPVGAAVVSRVTPMDAAELSDLIGRAQRREPEAFEALVNLYASRLYGYFYRLTGRRDEAEDLLQELFVRLVRTIERYEHDGRFDGWIFRIATNLIRDRVRRSKRMKGGALDADAHAGPAESNPLTRVPDPAAGHPGEGLEQAEQIDRLQWALSQLGEVEREVIVLRHFSQLTFREIADQMGTPLGTALARAHRGLAHLRELMEAGNRGLRDDTRQGPGAGEGRGRS